MKRVHGILVRRTLQAVAMALLVLSALLISACADDSGWLGHTTSTTLFPSQRSFQQELSGDGYGHSVVLIEKKGDAAIVVVWVAVERDKPARATNDAILEDAVTLARKYGVADSTEGRLRVELFDPAEGGSIKDLIFESRDFDLAGTAASYSFREDNIQAHLEDGQYFGFWAGNVETIPAEPETLPDYFFSGPTPTTELRVVDDVPVYTDPRTIKVPLWVFGNEVDVSASRTIARIHSAQAEGRPVLLYAVDESFGWEVLELENSAESGQSLDRQIVMWLPWGNSAGAVGTWTGDVTADIIFRMLAVYTVTR